VRAQRGEEDTERNYYHRGTEFAELLRNPNTGNLKRLPWERELWPAGMLPIDSSVSFREHFPANYELVLWG